MELGQKRRSRIVKRIERKDFGLRLSERDLDILEFAVEMKFVDQASIISKFFLDSRTTNVQGPQYPAQRIWKLMRHGLLKSQRPTFAGRAFYTATDLAFEVLTVQRSHKCFVSAVTAIDNRTFDHDRLVVDARLILESTGRVRRWMSERALKARHATFKSLKRDYQPDAVYVNHLGEEVAFELERSLKSEQRYEEKIRKYSDLIHRSIIDQKGIRRVFFVCASDESFDAISKLIRPYLEFMMVGKFSDLRNMKPVDPISFNAGESK